MEALFERTEKHLKVLTFMTLMTPVVSMMMDRLAG